MQMNKKYPSPFLTVDVKSPDVFENEKQLELVHIELESPVLKKEESK